MNRQYRHGDLLIVERSGLPEGAKVEKRRGDVILAEGEVTGHAHRIKDKGVQMWSAGDQRYITIEGPATLDHEEHGKIPLPAGTYEVIRQRVYSPEAVRNVAD